MRLLLDEQVPRRLKLKPDDTVRGVMARVVGC